MSLAHLGDAVQVTFNSVTGATVTATVTDPQGAVTVADTPVAEDPAGSGKFPYTFTPVGVDGVWQVLFRAVGVTEQVEPFWLRVLSASGRPPLATLGELLEVRPSLTADEQQLAASLLRRASDMLRATFDTDDRIAAGTLDAGLVATAAINMVLRVLNNPRGVRSETVGPFARTFDVARSVGHLMITDDERDLLLGSRKSSRRPRLIMATPGLAPYREVDERVRRWHH